MSFSDKKMLATEEEQIILEQYKESLKNCDLTKLFKDHGKSKVYYILGKKGIKPGKKLAEMRNKMMAKDFKSGIAPKEIAKKYDINQSYVYELLGKKGLKTFLSEEEQKRRNSKIREMYGTKKYTQEKLGQKFGLTRECISMIVTKTYPYND